MTSDHFGRGVAISGDTIVVGVWREDSAATSVNGNQSDNSATDSGAAYVFERSGGDLVAAGVSQGLEHRVALMSFGRSAAISGDTIVVGAKGEASAATGVNGDQSDNSATYSGAAYVFERSGGTWLWQAYLKASNPDAI